MFQIDILKNHENYCKFIFGERGGIKGMVEAGYKYIRKSGQLFSELDGEVIMLSVKNESYLALNDVGSKIWSHLEEARTPAELVDLLLEEYEIDKQQCETETFSFLEELVELDLIEECSAEAR